MIFITSVSSGSSVLPPLTAIFGDIVNFCHIASCSESELFFQDQNYLNDKRAQFFVIDVRDQASLVQKMAGVDIVFHCAALKHVILCERSPEQVVQTNIFGVQNIIAAAQQNNIEKVKHNL